MVTTQQRMIDGHTYMVSQLPARRALKLLRLLGEVAGPALGTLAASVKGKDLKTADVGATLGPALERLFAQLDDDALDKLINGALATTMVDGAELLPQFDLFFQGKLGTAVKVVAFALEVQFGDFFGGLAGTGFLTKAMAFASAGSATSTGPSGASSPSA